jgi:hypothetical protein
VGGRARERDDVALMPRQVLSFPPLYHVMLTIDQALATPSPQVVRVGTIVSTQSSIEKLPFLAGIARETNGPFRPSDTGACEKQRSPSPAGRWEIKFFRAQISHQVLANLRNRQALTSRRACTLALCSSTSITSTGSRPNGAQVNTRGNLHAIMRKTKARKMVLALKMRCAVSQVV